MTSQKIIRGDVLLPLIAAAALGFAVWGSAPWLVDRREPWDADWPFYSASMVLGGGAIAWHWPNRVTATFAGVWLGQVAALALLPTHAGNWLPLGAITTGIGSLLVLVGALLGKGLRRLSGK